MGRTVSFGLPALVAVFLWTTAQAGLEDDLGRNDVRVLSSAYEVRVGVTVVGAGLPARLERAGYSRVRRRPVSPGTYFWGHETFWIYRRADGRLGPAVLFGLRLDPDTGRVVGYRDAAGAESPPPRGGAKLEPETLAESFDPWSSAREPLRLGDLPDHVWRAVLAAEDARFFEHGGVDGRSIARAALRNARAGRVVQGGSTITQQLVKLRDLGPQRTMGRKVSEALRALRLEADYPKTEILEAYLNRVYFGHVDGLSIYGLGAASRALLSKSAVDLRLGEAALLAAMIQGPNRLDPRRHPERARDRRRWVLGRLRELGWASESDVRRAIDDGLPALRPAASPPTVPRALLGWVEREVAAETPRRTKRGRGVIVETTIDAELQRAAERAVISGLSELRRSLGRERSSGLSAALVSVDAGAGAVRAYVGGDPAASGDHLDRVRSARRQPGSTLKPLLLLEAFEDCGKRRPLYPARRVADRPLRIELPSGPWEPNNHDDAFRGSISIRESLVDSRNVPFVRLVRHCGFAATARRLRRAGLELPDPPPPSFVLGSVETTPLALAEAYTVFAGKGRWSQASPIERLTKPGGRRLARAGSSSHRVVDEESAYLVRDLMLDAVERGTARRAAIDGVEVWAKTGTTADAWFAGGAGSLVTVVWVGRDDGSALRASGAEAAGPIWHAFMAAAVAAYPPSPVRRPASIVESWVETSTGLIVGAPRTGARRELFRRGVVPPRRRWYRVDEPLPVLD